MFCKNCGAVLADDAEFCESCGTKIVTAAPSPAPEIPPAAEPAPIASESPVPGAPEGQKKSGIPMKIVAPIAAAVVVVAVVAGVLLKQGGSSVSVDARAECNFNNGGKLAYDDSTLYYVGRYTDDDEDTCVYSTSYVGTNKTQLSSNADITKIRLANDKILYFGHTDETYFIGQMDKDGQNDSIIIELERDSDSSFSDLDASKKALYYVYNDELHSCTLEGEEDTVLVSDVDDFVLVGGTIYYNTDESIFSYTIKNGETVEICAAESNLLSYDDGNIYFKNDDGIYYVPTTGDTVAQRVVNDDAVGRYVIDGENIYYIQQWEAEDIVSLAVAMDSDNYVSYAYMMVSCGNLEQVAKTGGAAVDVESNQYLAYSLFAYPDGMYAQVSIFSETLSLVEFE